MAHRSAAVVSPAHPVEPRGVDPGQQDQDEPVLPVEAGAWRRAPEHEDRLARAFSATSTERGRTASRPAAPASAATVLAGLSRFLPPWPSRRAQCPTAMITAWTKRLSMQSPSAWEWPIQSKELLKWEGGRDN